MKKIGIISYYWPPAGGPGVQRWLKLSKYLAKEGVELHVVTVDPAQATYPLRDEGLLSEVHPNIRTYHTGTSEKFGAYKKVTGKRSVPFSGFSGEEAKVSFVQKVARFVRGNFFVPDVRKGWNSHAYKAAVNIIQKHDVHIWVTTSPPHSSQLIGLKLQKKFDIQWIADFRDPWTDIYYYRKFYPTALTRWYEKGQERRVFSSCDALISVSPSWSRLYEKKGGLPEGSVFTLPNGFDPEDFAVLKPNRPEIFTILYAGTLASQYPVSELVAALNTLNFPIQITIIGSWDGQSEKDWAQAGDHMQVSFEEYMPKSVLNQKLLNCHMMLFLLPDVASANGHIPGKLFDYLGAGNPILGLGPTAGDAASIIRDAGAGQCFDYTDKAAIAQYVQQQYDKGAPRIDASRITEYARDEQAKKLLAEILK